MPDKNKTNKASKFRMMRPIQGQHVFGQPEGSVSTHISSVFESDGKYFVAPTITNKKAPYAGYQPQSFEEAYRAGEAIPFDSFDEAMFFSQNYKLPKHFDNMKKSKYKNGGKTPKKKNPLLQYDPSSDVYGTPAYGLETYQNAITRDSLALEDMLAPGPISRFFGYDENMFTDYGIGSELSKQLQVNRSNRDQLKPYTQEEMQELNYYMPAKPTTDFDEFLKQYQESGINDMKNGGLWANIHAKRKRIAAGSGERMRKPGSKGAPTEEALKRSQAKYGGKVLKYPDGGKFEDIFRPEGYYDSIYEGQVLPDSVDRSIPNTFYIQPFYNETTKEMMASGEQGFQGPQKRFSKQELSKSLPYIGQHVESTLLPIREKMLNARTKEEYDSLQKEYNDLMPASNLSRTVSNYLDSIAVQGFGFSKGDQVKIKKDMGGPAFKADYEAEDGEVIVGNVSLDRMYNGGMLKSYGTGGMYSLSGPTHAEGGIGIINNDSNPSYVFSNNPKLKVPKQFAKGGTYADAAKGMSKSLENIAEMRMGGEGYDKATANLMEPLAMKEFSNLYDAQEQFKIDNNIGGNPINTAFNGGGFDPNKYQNSSFSLPTGLGLNPNSGGLQAPGSLQMPGNLGAGAESAGQSNKQGLPAWMIGANLLGPATNILGGLFGQPATMDLGREQEETYRDFSSLARRYSTQQDKSLAGLRAGLEGSGVTGTQLRSNLQAGNIVNQQQAGQFYDTLAQQQAESDRQTDATNRAIRDQNLQKQMMEDQFAAQNDPMNKLTAGIGQLGQVGAQLGMDQMRLNNLGTANFGPFGDFLKGIIG